MMDTDRRRGVEIYEYIDTSTWTYTADTETHKDAVDINKVTA